MKVILYVGDAGYGLKRIFAQVLTDDGFVARDVQLPQVICKMLENSMFNIGSPKIEGDYV